eukprot:TRINITY_DN17327_c0_g1_i1.p4 TRINITY_DN17327_c0_g1~~TRINITY_DN17327_c0_g1_i1.p4  ORF type:complete len:105 (-),score=19.38 TRINITY_DN17327_c0_g1_i1:8-322(-)
MYGREAQALLQTCGGKLELPVAQQKLLVTAQYSLLAFKLQLELLLKFLAPSSRATTPVRRRLRRRRRRRRRSPTARPAGASKRSFLITGSAKCSHWSAPFALQL